MSARERCGRCGRYMATVDLFTESGYQDSWEECQNPRCLAAEREVERAYWAAIDDKNQALVDAFSVTAWSSSDPKGENHVG